MKVYRVLKIIKTILKTVSFILLFLGMVLYNIPVAVIGLIGSAPIVFIEIFDFTRSRRERQLRQSKIYKQLKKRKY